MQKLFIGLILLGFTADSALAASASWKNSQFLNCINPKTEKMLLNRLETKYLEHYFVFKLGSRAGGGYFNDILRFEMIQRTDVKQIKDAVGLDGKTQVVQSSSNTRKKTFAEIIVDHEQSELENEMILSGKNSWRLKILDLLTYTSRANSTYSLSVSLNINGLFGEENLSNTSIPTYEICSQLKKYLKQSKTSASLKNSGFYFREVGVQYPYQSYFISGDHPWMQ